MIFKAFQIKNYKSFVDSGRCTVQNGVTILAGQNESGKTNILTALAKINEKTPNFTIDEYSFGQPESPEIVYYFELLDSEICELKEKHPGIDVNPTLQVIVQTGTRNIVCNYKVMCEEGSAETATVEASFLSDIENMLPKFVIYKTATDELPDSFTVQDISKKSIIRLANYLNTDFATIFKETNQQRQRNLTSNLSRSLSADFSAKYKQKEVQLEFDINGSTITIYVQDKKANSHECGYEFKLSQRSTGLGWYLNFYIALKGEDLKPGDIILVDEPGMYLHPKAQQEMYGILNSEIRNNQIIYTTHSPYLIDSDKLYQLRLVEKVDTYTENYYNEASEIREKIHHTKNIDTLKPIADTIGYSLGSELNISNKKLLICEGVSDYYYIKALELIMGKELACGITHANGCNNISRVASLFLGLGIPEIFALVDSDAGGIRERTKLINDGVFEESKFMTTHETKNIDKAIEDIFNRAWYLKEIFEYNEADIIGADPSISKELKKKSGGAKYFWAKKLFDLATQSKLSAESVLTQDGIDLFEKLDRNTKG